MHPDLRFRRNNAPPATRGPATQAVVFDDKAVLVRVAGEHQTVEVKRNLAPDYGDDFMADHRTDIVLRCP